MGVFTLIRCKYTVCINEKVTVTIKESVIVYIWQGDAVDTCKDWNNSVISCSIIAYTVTIIVQLVDVMNTCKDCNNNDIAYIIVVYRVPFTSIVQ